MRLNQTAARCNIMGPVAPVLYRRPALRKNGYWFGPLVLWPSPSGWASSPPKGMLVPAIHDWQC
jgi:hypothetical protein